MFKFGLNQLIFFMRENKLHSAPVLSRHYVDNFKPEYAHTKEQKELFTRFGESRIEYSTCHGVIHENEAYASKEEMYSTLLGLTN
jgi:predicted DNA-binding protein with PD1-like motif